MSATRETLKRLLVALILALLGVVLYSRLVPAETAAVREQLLGFPDSDAMAHWARPVILGGLCFLPAIAALLYASGGTLARYMAREFLGILAICFAALFLVWLLQDLENNLSDLRESKHLMGAILKFYGTKLPFIIRELLPYALLLSLLFCLGKFSKSREIVAMIQTGRGLPRIVTPLIISGVMAAILCAALNYQWAPIAEGSSDQLLQEARGSMISEATNVLYPNPGRHRLWMVETFPKNYQKGEPLLHVDVTTTRDDKTLLTRMTAERAHWNRKDRSWTFDNATIGHFEPDQAPTFEQMTEPFVERSWAETPSQLIKPGLSAPFLGIPDLNSWLQANAANGKPLKTAPYLTQWHYRWAQPLICLVTVLLAAPLGIHFSRRGSTGGVTMAVALSGALVFLTTVSMALGEAEKLPPAIAAWLPNIVFAVLGIFLFHRRMAGRPIYQSLLKLFPGGN